MDYVVASTTIGGRQMMPKSYATMDEAKAWLAKPGVAFGTVYAKYVGGSVLYTTDPDDA